MTGTLNLEYLIAEMRMIAEQKLAREHPDLSEADSNVQKLLHELQVHQLELEMQHEALQKSMAETKDALADYADLFNFAPIAYCILDFNGCIKQLNASAEALLGIDQQRHNKKPFINFVSPADRALYMHFQQAILHSDSKQDCVLQLQCANDIIWTKVEAIFDHRQQHCLLAIIDITAQFIATEQLIQSEAALKEAQQIANIGYWQWDIERDTLLCSEQIYHILTRDKAKAFKSYQDWSDYFSAENWIALNNALTLCRSHGLSFELDLALSDPDVSGRWLSLRAQADRDSHARICRLHGTIQDISARKQSEAQLQKLSQAIEQSNDSILLTDLNAEIEYVNAAFLNKSGYSREEVLGKNLRFIKSSEDLPLSSLELWTNLAQGRSWHGEFHNQRKDGSAYIDYAIISPLIQADGQITAYISVQEDITEKKLIDEELRKYRTHLEDIIHERTAELALAKAAAESANRAKSSFLANMSHEIRTPMNAIIGLTYLLRNKLKNAEQIDRLNKIDSSAQHLLSIINDILDLSKIEAGYLQLDPSNFLLSELFDHLQSVVSGQIKTKGLTLSIDMDHVPLWLNGDLTRLRQALLNYLNNAIKFTDKGFIKLSSSLIQETAEGIWIRFEVQDSGIGIPADKVPLLFKEFSQADVSTTRHYGGTGLGLAITKNLAHLMQGEAGVSSAAGEGSTFWFTACLQRGTGEKIDALTESSDDIEARLLAYRGCRVLLVEDNLINQEVALALLSNVGLAVDMAENGVLALDKVHTQDYDLVLMDVQMPEMDGLAATRAIRTIPGKQDLVILAMTANAFDDNKLACLAAGMNDFVPKPVVPSVLYSSLLRWLPKPKELKPTALEHAVPSSSATGLENNRADVQSLANALAEISGLELSAFFLSLLANKPAKFISLLHIFAQHHQQDFPKVRTYVAEGNYQAAQNMSHSLKGAVSVIGMAQINAQVSQLDHALHTKAAIADCIQLIDACEAPLTAVITQILTLSSSIN